MRERPRAQACTSQEEADRRTSEVEAGTRISVEEVDRRTAVVEADRYIPVQVVDSRRREVGE